MDMVNLLTPRESIAWEMVNFPGGFDGCTHNPLLETSSTPMNYETEPGIQQIPLRSMQPIQKKEGGRSLCSTNAEPPSKEHRYFLNF